MRRNMKTEVIGYAKTKEEAERTRAECEEFLAIPFFVPKRTLMDRMFSRWQIRCYREHLENGVVWESV